MRVLLSEGSTPTSMQVAGRLAGLGHEVEVLSSTWFCLSRFTRHVRAVHAVPNFAADPFRWLDAAEFFARERQIDLLLPTQEQVTILSAREEKLKVAAIVPPFAALALMQDKVSAWRTLRETGAPQPESWVIAQPSDLASVKDFPVFIKRPIGTASSGVLRAENTDELAAAAADFGLGDREFLVQAQAEGPLAMVQAVADRGRLVAHHACLRAREGIAGGAALKQSVVLPGLRDLLARLAAHLSWHGALSMDVIDTAEGFRVIDVNPRLVEPANALAAGVDLVGALLALASGEAPAEQRAGRPGVRTRQAIIGVLGAAAREKTRRAVLCEARDAVRGSGPYAGSAEETTPVSGDPLTAVPLAAAVAGTLLYPPLWRKFYAGGVKSFALTPEAWERIVALSIRIAGIKAS